MFGRQGSSSEDLSHNDNPFGGLNEGEIDDSIYQADRKYSLEDLRQVIDAAGYSDTKPNKSLQDSLAQDLNQAQADPTNKASSKDSGTQFFGDAPGAKPKRSTAKSRLAPFLVVLVGFTIFNYVRDEIEEREEAAVEATEYDAMFTTVEPPGAVTDPALLEDESYVGLTRAEAIEAAAEDGVVLRIRDNNPSRWPYYSYERDRKLPINEDPMWAEKYLNDHPEEEQLFEVNRVHSQFNRESSVELEIIESKPEPAPLDERFQPKFVHFDGFRIGDVEFVEFDPKTTFEDFPDLRQAETLHAHIVERSVDGKVLPRNASLEYGTEIDFVVSCISGGPEEPDPIWAEYPDPCEGALENLD